MDQNIPEHIQVIDNVFQNTARNLEKEIKTEREPFKRIILFSKLDVIMEIMKDISLRIQIMPGHNQGNIEGEEWKRDS